MITRFATLFALLMLFSFPAGSAPLYEINFSPDQLDNFIMMPAGDFRQIEGEHGLFPAGESTRNGYQLELSSEQGTLFVTRNAIPTDGEPIVITLEYAMIRGAADIAVVALNAPDGVPDGQLAYTQVNDFGTEFEGTVRQLHILYSAPDDSISVGAQISKLSPTDDVSAVVLFSLKVYEWNPLPHSPLPTEPSGSFEEDSEAYLKNINQDQGEVVFQPEQNFALKTGSAGKVANLGVKVPEFPVNTTEQLLLASVRAARKTDDDGITALALIHSSWSTALFQKTTALQPAPDFSTLQLGASAPNSDEELIVIVQNSGGERESEIIVDDLMVQTISTESIVGRQASEPFEPADSLAATLLLPKTMFSGSQSSFTLTTLDIEKHQPISLPYQVTLQKGQQRLTLAEGVTSTGGFASQTFTVPEIETGTWKIMVETMDFSLLEGEAAIQEGGMLIIETDKPIYKPNQTIQGRVILLNNALSPLQNAVEVSISDGKGIKIHKETLNTNEYGVASFNLPLADDLNFGTWKISARSGSAVQVEQDIEVERYVLPAFEISVNMAKDWFLKDEEIIGTIDSRYFFGKPVQGTVTIEALRYISTWDTYATLSGRLTEGKFEFELPEVGYVAGTPGADGAGSVQLKVSIEDDTGHTEETDALLRIVDSGAVVKLIPESSVIKPGLSHELLIITETQDMQPLSGEVNLEIHFVSDQGSDTDTINETVSTNNGLLLFQFEVPEDTTLATVTASADFPQFDRIQETLMLHAAYSPGAGFIHLRQVSQGTLSVGSIAEFQVFATHKGTVFYDVYANGRTIFSNATEENVIRFQITPEMSPGAQVVAYMIQPNNEVAADVLPFTVELQTPLELQAQFSAEEVRPGEPVSLTIQSEEQAMVGLAVVDESVFALVKSRMNLRAIFNELERIFMKPQIEVHPGEGGPWTPQPFYGSKGAVDVLADHHLQVIATGNLSLPKAEPLDPWKFWQRRDLDLDFPVPEILLPVFDGAEGSGAPGGANQYQEPDRVRTFFPETWIWQPELLTDASGLATLELTAPDSITTWKLHALSTSPQGIGMTESSLRVFQDFFAEPDLPYSVIRGDEFPLVVRLFNYVDQEQTIQVTLENGADLGLKDDAVKEVTLPANGLGSVSFTIQPTRVGTIPVSVVARSTSRADAIRKDLRVEPEGVKQNIVHNGILKAASEVAIDITYPLPLPIQEDQEPGRILPPQPTIIPDSEKLRISITPSLVGQSMSGLDGLLEMPFGCGEQNMIFLAPDIEIIRYLKMTGQLAPEIRAQAEFFVTTGYQRELTFQRTDGSFSAFGMDDDSGSLWLTAFVLSTFSSAREIRTIDENVLQQASDWILSHQEADGHWEPVGFVIHTEMVGGQEGELALTAFVTLALLEYGEADPDALQKALDYLSTHATSDEVSDYVLSMIAYALTLAEHPAAESTLNLLLEHQKSDSNGIYWEPHPIETTAYVAMTLILQSRPEAQPALQWIAAQRNQLGGYGTTQDTVVAFKALTMAAAIQSRDLNGEIQVLVNDEVIHTFRVNSENFDVLQTLDPEPAERVTLRMSGSGSVLYQVAQSFNVPAFTLPEEKDLTLDVEYVTDHIEQDDLVDVNVSVLYSGEYPETGMSIVDISIPTGFEVVPETLDNVREMELIKRIEQAGRKLIFYIDHLTLGETLSFGFQIRAKYPVKVDAGTSSAYLYYDPDTRAEVQGPKIEVN